MTLADRLRPLAVLDQEGSLSMSDCFSIIRYGEPVAVVVPMINSFTHDLFAKVLRWRKIDLVYQA